MRIIRGVSTLSVAALIGCASAQGSGEPAPPAPARETVRISTTGAAGMGTTGTSSMELSSTPNVGVVTLAAPSDRVWTELVAVYAALGIEASTLDRTNRIIGNPSLKTRRRLGTVNLTKYIDCGSTQGAPSAESYEVLLTIHSQLQSATPNNTTVTTTFQSMGRPVSQSGEYRTCTSTGALEKSIGDLLRTRLSM